MQKPFFKIHYGKPQNKTEDRNNYTRDCVSLNLWGINLSVSRETTSDTPAELSVILPRAEYRQQCSHEHPGNCSTEMIISSITVVISPQR